MQIKDQIRQRREQLGIGLREFAQMLQVTDMAVRHWESGRSAPGKQTAKKIEEVLDFRLDWNESALAASPTTDQTISDSEMALLVALRSLSPPVRRSIKEAVFVLAAEARHVSDATASAAAAKGPSEES